MRLLNSKSRQLELLHHQRSRYAIVSHRWGQDSEEVLFTDIGDPARAQSKGKGYEKISGSCIQAMRDGLDYVWLDTCCIDKSNNTELSEAINSMYRWYHNSQVCYAYLHDVSEASEFTKSDWFSRGWTLQELIAPKVLNFFTRDWIFIGTRDDLLDLIAERTGINPDILRSAKTLNEVSISQKMFWAAKRVTTKVEDRAYSLLGILNVNMIPVYGIEDAAFEELQHKIIAKHSDQTLFAWHHTAPPPEDVEMADAKLASDPVPDPPPKGDTTGPQNTPTGLLATSPSQYRVSYEIPENDFRKNYVDSIREHSYRTYFSVSNNLVHISLPVKHVAGKLWKAVLRCSFEPPDGDKPQRPLIIYLEETHPWKYIRTHLRRDEMQEGDIQIDDENSVPGSLERLSDAESKLEGYILRDIDVVGRHGASPSDNQPRPPPSDPDALLNNEVDHIARLPRHPPGVKTTNLIVCGEPGVAAGRVINLIIGETIIKPLTDYEREPMAVTVIDATLQSKNIRILYIIGPRDPYLDLDAYHITIRNMYQLVQQAKEAEGIHLVLLCMVGSRITGAVESNYHMFYDYVCHRQVPMMLVVTGLGKTRRMEDWWDRHKTDQGLQAMSFLQHACITVLQGEDKEHEKKHKDSAQRIREMLMDFIGHLETTPKVYCPEDAHRWFVFMGRRTMDMLLHGQKKSLKQEAVAKTLREGTNLNEVEANNLVTQFFDERTMEL